MAGGRRQAQRDSSQTRGGVLVVLPTYNEAENIADILVAVRNVAPARRCARRRRCEPGRNGAHRGGHSPRARPDPSAQPHRQERPRRRLPRRVRVGPERGYDVLVEMDADGSHDPAHLPALLAAVEAGADLTVGSLRARRTDPRWSPGRRALSRSGQPLRRRRAEAVGRRRDFGLPSVQSRHPAPPRSGDPGCRRLRIPDRSGLAGHPPGRARHRGSDLLPGPRAGESKMSKAIVLEAMRLVTQWGAIERWENAVDALAHPVLHQTPTRGLTP